MMLSAHIQEYVEGLTLKYTEHLVCRNDVSSLTLGGEGIVFDSYFPDDTCTNKQMFDCIMASNILPKVCNEMILSYLPNEVLVSAQNHSLVDDFGIWIFSLNITINDITYKFVRHANCIQRSGNHNYVDIKGFVEYFSFAEHVFKNVAYTDDYDILLKDIDSVMNGFYKCKIINLKMFLKIICCVKLLEQVVPKQNTKI